MVTLEPRLKSWISESESWQAFIDFRIPEDEKANYTFLKRWDDFYLSLMAKVFDVLAINEFEENKKTILSLAKGLIIYSLENKKEYFSGVNVNDNLLYAAGLYYLAGYPASALLLAKSIKNNFIKRPIDKFILNFLKRDIIHDKLSLSNWLHYFLITGQDRYIKYALSKIQGDKNSAFENDYESFASFTLAEALVTEFSTNNIWLDLMRQNSSPNYWNEYIQACLMKPVPMWNFFPSQRAALIQGALSEDTCSFQMPTSAGKSALSELIIYNAWKEKSSSKILYLAPFRSLAAELRTSIGVNLTKLGLNVKVIYGGNLPTAEEKETIQSANLLISTPEKLLAVEDVLTNFLFSFDTIICDEGHLLDDQNRGLSYELLLSRLKGMNSFNRKKFVFISAIIPNISSINSWLGGNENTVVESIYRPTELEYAFLRKRNNNAYDLEVNPLAVQPDKYTLYRFLLLNELKYSLSNKASITTKKGITVASALKVINSGSTAIFCSEKGAVWALEIYHLK